MASIAASEESKLSYEINPYPLLLPVSGSLAIYKNNIDLIRLFIIN